LDDSNEKFLINDYYNQNHNFENKDMKEHIFVNQKNKEDLDLNLGEESARINLIESSSQDRNLMSSDIIKLFQKLRIDNNYKLCISGEAFRVIISKIKSIIDEISKKNQKFIEAEILNGNKDVV